MFQLELLTNKTKEQSKSLQEKKSELEKKLSHAHEDHLDISSLNAELAEATEMVDLYNSLVRKLSIFKQNEDIIKAGSERELIEIAKSEQEGLTQEIETLLTDIEEKEIKQKLSDPDDSKSVVLEIRAGAGGDEAALFAADLFRMYKAFAVKQNWAVSIIDSSISESGGFKQLVAQIKGPSVYKYLKHESGVHRVQRIPSTESSGRIHTSTASVAILPEAKDIEVDIREEDLRVDTMRSSGPGGQSVNTTTSAVRITHIPTGIVVSCQDTKVQQQNKEKAMEILRARLYEKKRQEEAQKRSDLRSSQIGSAMRAEKIRTYNFPQSRVTDHRIKKSWHNLESIMNGEIEDMLQEIGSELLKQLLEKVKRKKMHHNKRDFTSQPLLQKQAKIIQLLEQSGYVDSSRISKEIIEFTGGDLEKIDIVLADIAANKPWEYIRGWTIFDGNKIKVSKDTLIPRVETEDLVEAAEAAILDLLQRYQEKISIIDLGTGSGAVIISLYKRLLVQRIRVKFLASDVSISVLDVVRANISENLIKPEAIELIQSDLLADLKFQHKTVFIVANLPYIPVTEMSDLEPSVKEYEPRLALDGGEDGINIYKRLFDQLKEQSKKHSFSGIIETHSRSINQLAEYVRQSYSSVQILPDRFNRPRFIKCS